MTYFNPPHEIKDKAKLQSMIDTLEKGGQLPPVVVYGNDALTGSHRIAAWVAVDQDAQVVELTDKEFILATALSNGVDDLDINDPDDIEFYHKHLAQDVCDYNEFCEALSKVSENSNVLEAIKDQF